MANLLDTLDPADRGALYVGYAVQGLGVAVKRNDPAEALRAIVRARLDLGAAEAAYVKALRDSGATWARVGHALSIERHSAWERFHART